MAKLSIASNASSFEGGAARKIETEEVVAPVSERRRTKRTEYPTEKTTRSKAEVDAEDAVLTEELREQIKTGRAKTQTAKEGARQYGRAQQIEQAKKLLPEGDKVWELVNKKLEDNPTAKMQIGVEREQEPAAFGSAFDSATEYVRMLAAYRKAVEGGNDAERRKLLDRVVRMNETLGIPLNAEIQQHLEDEDVIYTAKKHHENKAAYAGNELESIIKQSPGMKMTVEGIQSQRLVAHPDKVWDLVADMLPADKRGMATDYVFALASLNAGARGLNVAAYDKAWSALSRMNETLGLEGNALIQSEMLKRPEEGVKNPFE
jgi:hypothetical protein